jgi:hypothetical protein
MPAARSPLVAPTVAFLSTTYPARPDTTVAPLRLAMVRAALATGTFAVLTVELLGAADALTRSAIAVAWLIFLAATATFAWWRWHRHRWSPAAGRLRSFWRTASRGERLLAGATAGLVLVELLIALLAPPNNFDSQTYHLPKVEHWVAQGNLNFWPTAIHRQVTLAPGAEYLLLHLRLLTGGDTLYNLVQWAAGVGCLVIASRIAAQLGGDRRAQLITAFLVATTPMVALQATSTQTDLVVAAWTGCVATLVLDALTRRATAGSALGLGVATGLAAVTKTTGLLAAGPLLVLWGLDQLRLAVAAPPPPGGSPRGAAGPVSADSDSSVPADSVPAGAVSDSAAQRGRGVLRTAGAAVAVLAVAAVITGPFVLRVAAEFGNPLGPPQLRDSIPMQRHDPASILINALRIGQTALDTPIAPLRTVTGSAINGLATLVGINPQDPAITFGQTPFPVQSWYPDEDRAAYPIAGALALIGGLLALARPRRIVPEHAHRLRAYAAAIGTAALLHAATIKWQPWGNRLLLYCLVLGTPLAGLWLDALFRRRATAGRRSVATVVTVAVLATSALAGVLALSYGYPRRLVGTGSLLTTSEWDLRFLRRPQWMEEFRWAAAHVNAAGARRVGLVQQNDNWEYPWWLLLRDGPGAGRGGHREIVALQSVLPHHPPADPNSVDAIVCTGDHAACDRLVPRGWHVEFRGYVGYALPPTKR